MTGGTRGIGYAIVETFLTTEFGGGRHTGRVQKIMREDDPSFEGVPVDFTGQE